MNEDDKLRIYIAPSRISRLPRGYRHLDQRGDKWARLTFLIIFITGSLMLYGFYRAFR